MIEMKNTSTSKKIKLMDGISSIPMKSDGEFFIKLNNFIDGFRSYWPRELKKDSEMFLRILNGYNTSLQTELQRMPWPIRTKDEIRMYLTLFIDELLEATKNNKEQFPNRSSEMLLLIIRSLIPTTSVIMEESAQVEQKQRNIITMIHKGECSKHKDLGDLTTACKDLPEYFGIIEQRNIGAPQFCITSTDWKKDKICFEGYVWAAVPVGVYRKEEITEKEEVGMFKENYFTMMKTLRVALGACTFDKMDDSCDVGFKFTAEYTPDKALEYIKNWFKVCLFTAGTALFVTKNRKFIGGKQSMINDIEATWPEGEDGVLSVSCKIHNHANDLVKALTTSTEESHKMLRGLMKGLGWELSKSSGAVLTYTCTRPLWSLIHGLRCWMSKTVLEDFCLSSYANDPNNYCTYVVELQNKTGEKIWNSEAMPNSLVYRPDNPNFTEEESVGLNYHIHVFKGKKGDEKFEGGKGFSMGNYKTAAPLWQGFNIYTDCKK